MELGSNLITPENLELIGFAEVTEDGVKIHRRGKCKLQFIREGVYELNAGCNTSIGEIGKEISEKINSN